MVPPLKGTEWLVVRVCPSLPRLQGGSHLGSGVSQAGGMPLVPLVINAQAGQPGYRVPLKQLLQADHTLTRVFSQHVICKGGTEGGRGSVTSRWAARSRYTYI